MPSPRAYLGPIAYYLPPNTLTNPEIAAEFPEWSVEKISQKTGIYSRHIAGPNETSGDMGLLAGKKLLSDFEIDPSSIDFLLFCTQSPDYFLPSTSCILQDKLGLPNSCGALDFNLGCSGFVYGLSLAKGLIASAQARNVLLICSETYSKFLNPKDKSVRTIFGDGASACLISERKTPGSGELLEFVFGTDGKGFKNLIVPGGAARSNFAPSWPSISNFEKPKSEESFERKPTALYMNGPAIFNFTLERIPESMEMILKKSGLTLEQVDGFVFHQANEFMLETLRKRLKIPKERFFLNLSQCGNTVSSTIPIALSEARLDKKIGDLNNIILVGFGVGYSWASARLQF